MLVLFGIGFVYVFNIATLFSLAMFYAGAFIMKDKRDSSVCEYVQRERDRQTDRKTQREG